MRSQWAQNDDVMTFFMTFCERSKCIPPTHTFFFFNISPQGIPPTPAPTPSSHAHTRPSKVPSLCHTSELSIKVESCVCVCVCVCVCLSKKGCDNETKVSDDSPLSLPSPSLPLSPSPSPSFPSHYLSLRLGKTSKIYGPSLFP